MDQHLPFIGEGTRISISIAYRDRGNPHFFLSRKGASIADRCARLHVLDKCDMADQAEGRPEINGLFIHFV